jgi:hypothetical protein
MKMIDCTFSKQWIHFFRSERLKCFGRVHRTHVSHTKVDAESLQHTEESQ